MAKRDNHYEAAFEEFLRQRQIPDVAVDVKGRRFPAGEQKQYWKNSSTRDDVRSLRGWELLFGPSFSGRFVFAYEVVGDCAPVKPEKLFEYGGKLYGFVAVRSTDYAAQAHSISSAWDTRAMPANRFRSLAAPVEDCFCQGEPLEPAQEPTFVSAA